MDLRRDGSLLTHAAIMSKIEDRLQEIDLKIVAIVCHLSDSDDRNIERQELEVDHNHEGGCHSHGEPRIDLEPHLCCGSDNATISQYKLSQHIRGRLI